MEYDLYIIKSENQPIFQEMQDRENERNRKHQIESKDKEKELDYKKEKDKIENDLKQKLEKEKQDFEYKMKNLDLEINKAIKEIEKDRKLESDNIELKKAALSKMNSISEDVALKILGIDNSNTQSHQGNDANKPTI